MKSKPIKTIVIVLIVVSLVAALIWGAAKCVFLSPSCYSDNKNLTEEENYFIKKLVLEAVENRLSLFADGDAGKHILVFINGNFMDSVSKDDNGYTVVVQSYFMEAVSEDCLYQIEITKDFSITSFELDP